MKIVNDCGSLYRLSEKRYKKYLMDGLTGGEPNAKEYGKPIGYISFHALDARREDYQEAYETTYEGGPAAPPNVPSDCPHCGNVGFDGGCATCGRTPIPGGMGATEDAT